MALKYVHICTGRNHNTPNYCTPYTHPISICQPGSILQHSLCTCMPFSPKPNLCSVVLKATALKHVQSLLGAITGSYTIPFLPQDREAKLPLRLTLWSADVISSNARAHTLNSLNTLGCFVTSLYIFMWDWGVRIRWRCSGWTVVGLCPRFHHSFTNLQKFD